MSLGLQIELLIAFGVLLIIAEAVIPAFGLLALVGAVAFVWGGILVHAHPEIHTALINPATIWGLAVIVILFFIATALLIHKAYKKPITTGQESLVGKIATILTWTKSDKTIQIQGEIWKAKSTSPLTNLKTGDSVEITGADGLTLIITDTSSS